MNPQDTTVANLNDGVGPHHLDTTVEPTNTTQDFLDAEHPFGPDFEAPPLPEGSEYYKGMPPLKESTQYYEPTDPLVLHALNLRRAHTKATQELAELKKLMEAERNAWQSQVKPIANKYKEIASSLPEVAPTVDDWDANSIGAVVDYHSKKQFIDNYAEVARQAVIAEREAFKAAHEEFADPQFGAAYVEFCNANTEKIQSGALTMEDTYKLVAFDYHRKANPANQANQVFASQIQSRNRDVEARQTAALIGSGSRVEYKVDYSKAKSFEDIGRITEEYKKRTGREPSIEDLPSWSFR